VDGLTWTIPVELNDDIGYQAQHFFPTIAVSTGVISVAWYDSRLNIGDAMTSLDVYYAYSTNGGVTFSRNIRITTASFDPDAVKRTDDPNENEPFIGDYLQMVSTPSNAHLIWTDNRSACDTFDPAYGCVDQDAFTATVNIRDFNMTALSSTFGATEGQLGTVEVRFASQSLLGSNNVSVSVASSPVGLRFSPSRAVLNLTAGQEKILNVSVTPLLSTSEQGYTLNLTAVSRFSSHALLVRFDIINPVFECGTCGKVLPYILIGALAVIVVTVLMLYRFDQRRARPSSPA